MGVPSNTAIEGCNKFIHIFQVSVSDIDIMLAPHVPRLISHPLILFHF